MSMTCDKAHDTISLYLEQALDNGPHLNLREESDPGRNQEPPGKMCTGLGARRGNAEGWSIAGGGGGEAAAEPVCGSPWHCPTPGLIPRALQVAAAQFLGRWFPYA